MSHTPPETDAPIVGTVRRSQSVRVRLLALLAVSQLIMFVIIGLSIFFLLFRFERNAWQDRQQEAARYSKNIMEQFLTNVQNSLSTIAFLDREQLEAYPDILKSLLQQDPALLEAIRLDDKGQVLASTYLDAPQLANRFAVAQSDWFVTARNGQRYLGAAQISSENQPYTIIALPAAGGGVVAARLSMNVLWSLMSDLPFGATGAGYVIDRDGHIIAHSNPDIVRAYSQIDLPPAASAGSSELYTNFAGVPVVGVQTPLQGTPWTLVSEVSQAEAFATTRAASWLIIGALVLLGAVTLFFADRILDRILLRPLQALQTGAARVGQGDLDYRISITRADEIGYAAGIFNQMADKLRDMLDTLEMRVEMRTAQIAASADVGRAVTSFLDPEVLLKQVVSLITDRSGYYYAAAFTLDPAGQHAVLREAAGPSDAAWLLKQVGHKPGTQR